MYIIIIMQTHDHYASSQGDILILNMLKLNLRFALFYKYVTVFLVQQISESLF